jgi:hypothetical protein
MIIIKYLTLILSLFIFNVAFATDYSHIDPDHLIPNKMLISALSYYDLNINSIPNKRFVSLIDYRQHSSKERLYIVDMESGEVEKYLVAHGKNSDPDNDGYATEFSNIINSKQSSLGFFLAAETYDGSHGYSLRLDGLDESNSNARVRDIVIHPADYVTTGRKAGRSFGCPSIDIRFHKQIIDQIRDGSLIYASY